MNTSELPALAHPLFSEIDRQLGRLLDRLAGGHWPNIALAAALASHQYRTGHRFLDFTRPDLALPGGIPATLVLPERDSWLNELRASRVVGEPGTFKPLILDDAERLFLDRAWEAGEPSSADSMTTHSTATGSIGTSLS